MKPNEKVHNLKLNLFHAISYNVPVFTNPRKLRQLQLPATTAVRFSGLSACPFPFPAKLPLAGQGSVSAGPSREYYVKSDVSDFIDYSYQLLYISSKLTSVSFVRKINTIYRKCIHEAIETEKSFIRYN